MTPIVPHITAPIYDKMNKRDRRCIRRCLDGLRGVSSTKQVQQHLNNRAKPTSRVKYNPGGNKWATPQ